MSDFFSISIEETSWEYRIPPKTFEEKVLRQCNIAGRKTISAIDIPDAIRKKLYDAGIYFLDQLESQTMNNLMSMNITLWTVENIESILMVRNRHFRGFRKGE